MTNVETVQYCFADIAIATARHFGIESRHLKSPRRLQRYCRHRWVAMHLARQLTPLSLTQLGEKFHRDHTTILHGLRRAAELAQSDPDFIADVQGARAILERATPFRKIMFDKTADMRAALPMPLSETWV